MHAGLPSKHNLPEIVTSFSSVGDGRKVAGQLTARALRSHIISMKYKHIPSLVHNFTDSFVSLVNYSEDGYVMDLVEIFLRKNGGRVVVKWTPALEVSHLSLPSGVVRAARRYADWFPRLAQSMGVDSARIPMLLTVFEEDGQRVKVDTTGADDRGRIVSVPSKFWPER